MFIDISIFFRFMWISQTYYQSIRKEGLSIESQIVQYKTNFIYKCIIFDNHENLKLVWSLECER